MKDTIKAKESTYEATHKDLQLSDFDVIGVDINEKEKQASFFLKPKQEKWSCPFCNSSDTIKFGHIERFARDLNYFEYNVALNINSHRHKCNHCGRTFREEYNSISPRDKMTKRLSNKIVEEASNETFLSVATRYRISVEEVSRCFKEYVDELDNQRELKAPRVLGIDEAHLCDDMRGVFVDVENKLLIELLETRKKIDVIRFLKKLGPGVQVVTIDMWKSYKEAVCVVYPNATIVIDRFHVVKVGNEAFDDIRKKISNKIKNKNKRVNLKHAAKILLMNPTDLTDEDRNELQLVFDEYPELLEPYTLKESFRSIYFCETREEAESAFLKWKLYIEAKASEYPQFIKVINTVENWYEYIFNYFDHKYTNAIAESINNLIKSIEKAGRGYSFPMLRAKILYRTKATKKPSILKSSLPTKKDMFNMFVSFTSSPIYKHGWGVDIRELNDILEEENTPNNEQLDLFEREWQ